MNHEFWNEIGNLYFMCGAYEPAIHAYLRSIKLENTFGRSYSNLALAYVQTGKYSDAIKLYRRSIELLSDKKEKAVTWNQLGILYRQIKEYDNALEAYQRADLIMPQEDAEKILEVRIEANRPLTVSMPEIDLDAILAKGNFAKIEMKSDLLTEINAEFEMAELHPDAAKFEEMTAAPPEKASRQCEFENYLQLEEAILTPPINTHSEWRLAYTEEASISESALPEHEPALIELENAGSIVPIEIHSEAVVEEDAPVNMPTPWLSAASEAIDSMESATFLENHSETIKTVTSAIDAEATQYLQTEYPLTDLSAEEQDLLKLKIIKYQQATGKHPRNYILWDELGETYKSAGQYKDAIQAFQKAIQLHPTNPMCHYRLGLVYAAERKEQEAIRSFKKVLELDPMSAQAHASLASQYRKMGLEEAAQEHIEKARAMPQFEEESDYNRACLEAICGNNERALDLLEVALQSKQTYVTWAQNDPDFDSLRKDHRFQTLLSTHAVAA